MPLNVPNVLTLFRLLVIPFMIAAYYAPVPGGRAWAMVLFILGASTDWLDGYLARRLGQTSSFGAFLDPVADKVLVAVALVLIVQSQPSAWLAVPAAAIIGREIVVSALREWLALAGERARAAVTPMAKGKTMSQMIAISLLMYGAPLAGFPTAAVGLVMLYVAALLTLWSMWSYLRAAWPALRGRRTAAAPAKPKARGAGSAKARQIAP